MKAQKGERSYERLKKKKGSQNAKWFIKCMVSRELQYNGEKEKRSVLK
jgi:hypothetical protein